jgi:hypothetical protein
MGIVWEYDMDGKNIYHGGGSCPVLVAGGSLLVSPLRWGKRWVLGGLTKKPSIHAHSNSKKRKEKRREREKRN